LPPALCRTHCQRATANPMMTRVCLFRGVVRTWRVFALLGMGLITMFRPQDAAGQSVTQTFNLRAGWNSIWLEVAPADPRPAVLFAGRPIESVWTFRGRPSAADFIQNVNEPVWNRERWLVFVPTNKVEALNNDLYGVQVNRAYLINATAPFTLSVAGRPSLRIPGWEPDNFNLRGFPVDPARPPTFQNFFRNSSAHFDASLQRLERFFRLNASGVWSQVSGAEVIQPGEAYWAFSRGASDFIAPIVPDLLVGDGLDFGQATERISLEIRNGSTSPATAEVRDLSSAKLLSTAYFSPSNGVEWAVLTNTRRQSIAGSGRIRWDFGIRRAAMTGSNHATTVELTDGAGTRI